MTLINTVLLSGLLSTGAWAGISPDQGTSVDRIFAQWTRATPGCAVAVSKAGHLEYASAYGSADLEHGIPNSLDTVFEAGSISKQFTAMAVLMLARDGRLSLDDPARKYVPELPDYGEPVTIREMLTHTSGLRDWGDVATLEGWPRTTRVYDDADILDIIGRQRELNFAPGTRWSYNNTGYNLAEIIVSRVSGLSLAEFTKERIFQPLGMAHTSWRNDYTRVVPNRAIAYSRKGDGFHADMPFENTYGHAGLLTTVGDLLKWNEHLASPGVADSELVATQQRTAFLKNGRPTDYGYGLFIRKFKGTPEISHTGSTAGYSAYLARYPGVHLSVAMLCNVAEVDTWKYGHAIADPFIPDPPTSRSTHERDFPLSAAQTNRVLGTYRDVLSGRPVNLSSESGRILWGVHAVMRPISPTRFHLNHTMAELDESGMLTISDAYGIVDRYQRVAPVGPASMQPLMLAGSYASPEITGDVSVLAKDGAVTLQFGTKDTSTLEPAGDNSFSNELVTAVFSVGDDGRSTRLTISTDRLWNLRLNRVK